jgi:hypothetical protein
MKYKKMRNIAAQNLALRNFKEIAIDVLLGCYALGTSIAYDPAEIDIEPEVFTLPVADESCGAGGFTISGRRIDPSEIGIYE